MQYIHLEKYLLSTDGEAEFRQLPLCFGPLFVHWMENMIQI